jgi:hypothetical protein
MFKNRSSDQVQVKEGARFRHCPDKSRAAIARVIGISSARGIPHVRFQLEFERAPGELVIDGPRLLCLETFTRLYREPVAV